MKQYYFLILFALALFSSCGPTPQQASQYNNKLIEEQKKAVGQLDQLIASLNTFQKSTMENAYRETLEQLDSSIANLEKIKPFDGSTEYRDTTIALLKTYKRVVEQDFKVVIEKLSLPEEKYGEAEQKIVSSKLSEIQEKLTDANARFKEYQQKFAQKYNIQLTGNDVE